MLNDVLTLATLGLLYTTVLSTYTHVDPTAFEVLAWETNCTGEVTLAPLTGEQMRTLLTVGLVQELVD